MSYAELFSTPPRLVRGTAQVAVLLLIAAACDEGPGCADTLSITASVAQFYATEPFEVAAVWSGNGTGCPDDFQWTATPPMGFVGVTTGQTLRVVASAPGTGALTVRAGDGEFTATRAFDVGSPTGELEIEFIGLGFGASPDLDLEGPNGFTHKVTESGVVTGLPPGVYQWTLNTVTGGPLGHRWGPKARIGHVEIFKNTRFKQTIEYLRETGQIDFEALNVPETVTGHFARITRDTFSVDLMASRASVAVEPGVYTYHTFEVDSTGYRFVPDVFSGTQLVGTGADVGLPVPYSPVRGFLILEAPGMPEGATVNGELRTPTSVTPVVVPGAEYQTAGTYALDVSELQGWINTTEQQIEHYIPIPSSSTIEIPGGRATRVSTVMHRATWRAAFNAEITVLSDPGQNAGSIGFAPTFSMQAVVSFARPPDSLVTITVSGVTPWVTVAGKLEADSTFVATGSGVVASFPNVPVSLTGRLFADGSIEGTYQMGSDTVPKGVPSGPVRYRIVAARIPPGSAMLSPAGSR